MIGRYDIHVSCGEVLVTGRPWAGPLDIANFAKAAQ